MIIPEEYSSRVTNSVIIGQELMQKLDLDSNQPGNRISWVINRSQWSHVTSGLKMNSAVMKKIQLKPMKFHPIDLMMKSMQPGHLVLSAT